MPSARSVTATAPRPRTRASSSRRRRGSRSTPKTRIRWDRLARVGLLVVLMIVGGLYIKQALAYLSARSQAHQQESIVRGLRDENASLAKQQDSLRSPQTVQREARALGMVRVGERPYVITGLPNR